MSRNQQCGKLELLHFLSHSVSWKRTFSKLYKVKFMQICTVYL